MTGEAPWMGVTPQPPSDSELRVVQVAEEWTGERWTKDQVGAMLGEMVAELERQMPDGADPRLFNMRIDLTVRVPWLDQPESR